MFPGELSEMVIFNFFKTLLICFLDQPPSFLETLSQPQQLPSNKFLLEQILFEHLHVPNVVLVYSFYLS